MDNLKYKLLILFFIFLNACSSIPKNTADGCSIFSQKYLWYKHAKKTEQKTKVETKPKPEIQSKVVEDKVKKAVSWLQNNGVEYQYVDLRSKTFDNSKVDDWLRQVGSEQLLNKKSRTWRN